jgi:hypothetical protein|tara:strand:- start:69 stop:263 length:195 start_codon:yes stop_codon:yes gene_type:complete
MKFKLHKSKLYTMPKLSRKDRIARLRARIELQRKSMLPVVDVVYDNKNNVVQFTADTGWKTYKP